MARAFRVTKGFLFIILFFKTFSSYCQPYSLSITTHPSNPDLLKKIKPRNSYPDSNHVKVFLSDILSLAHSKGYLLAEISASDWGNKKIDVVIDLKKQFHISEIRNGNIPEPVLARAGYSERDLGKMLFEANGEKSIYEKILDAYEDYGYPFASVSLDSVSFRADTISAVLISKPGQLMELDTLEIAGNVKISKSFLQSYLDLKSGSKYNKSRIKDAEQKLKQLPFIKSLRPPKLTFAGNKARITLFLAEENASQFDGVLGFLANKDTGKPQFTGNLKLQLVNALKHGEGFEFTFRGLPGKSREMNLGASFPLVFSSPLGADLRFNLFRQDTSFQNVTIRGGVSYRLIKGGMSFFIVNRTGDPLFSGISGASSGSSVAQVKSLSYGSGFHFNTTDSPVFPRRGIRINLEAEAGRKSFSRDSSSRGPEGKGKSAEYRFRENAEAYIPLTKRSVIKMNNQTGLLIGKDFFENEFYRIGGFNSLRGFDEQSLLASNYSYLNLEYRLLIENRSFLFAFGNAGLINYRIWQTVHNDQLIGFGAGISLETKPGIFSLSYAVGKQKDIPLNLQGGKIHFGLVTYF